MVLTRTLLGILLQFGFSLLWAMKHSELRSPCQVILLQLLVQYGNEQNAFCSLRGCLNEDRQESGNSCYLHLLPVHYFSTISLNSKLEKESILCGPDSSDNLRFSGSVLSTINQMRRSSTLHTVQWLCILPIHHMPEASDCGSDIPVKHCLSYWESTSTITVRRTYKPGIPLALTLPKKRRHFKEIILMI